MFACRVCGADSRDEVCEDCRTPTNHKPTCAICDGVVAMPSIGNWTICPDCSTWAMGAEHWRDINNRSVIMVDPETFIAGVRRLRDLHEQRDALVAALEDRDNIAANLIAQNRLGTQLGQAAERIIAVARIAANAYWSDRVVADETNVSVECVRAIQDLYAVIGEYDAGAERSEHGSH